MTTVNLQAEAPATIQEIKSLGVLQTETCHYKRHVSICKFESWILKSQLVTWFIFLHHKLFGTPFGTPFETHVTNRDFKIQNL